MSLLTGPEIQRQMQLGNIVITPGPSKVNPNSVNLRLADKLKVYPAARCPYLDSYTLDPKRDTPTDELQIGFDGIVLYPSVLYLGSTVEYTESHCHVPVVQGRSSLGRLGVSIHATAGFGDVGFCGQWTLELFVIHPVRLYAGMDICQICWHTVEGELQKYAGKYQNQIGVVASRLHEEMGK